MSERKPPLFSGRPRCPLIGVLHLPPLPGSVGFAGGRWNDLTERIAADLAALAPGSEAGVDAVIVENFGDAPFSKGEVPPVTVAAMTAILSKFPLPVPFGVNVLRNDARAALSIAAVTGAAFVRVNVLSGVYATDQGIIEGKAREVLEVRSRLCPEVRIFADVLVKHALPLGEGDLVRAARDTVLRAGADAVIVTGTQTGSPPEVGEVKRLRKALPAPILVGSGLTPENVADYLPFADGLIVGSTFKEGGDPRAPVSRPRVKAFLARLSRLRDRSRRSDRRPPPEGRVLP